MKDNLEEVMREIDDAICVRDGVRTVRVRVVIGEPAGFKHVFGANHVVMEASVAGYDNSPRHHAKLLRMLADTLDPDRPQGVDISEEPI